MSGGSSQRSKYSFRRRNMSRRRPGTSASICSYKDEASGTDQYPAACAALRGHLRHSLRPPSTSLPLHLLNGALRPANPARHPQRTAKLPSGSCSALLDPKKSRGLFSPVAKQSSTHRGGARGKGRQGLEPAAREPCAMPEAYQYASEPRPAKGNGAASKYRTKRNGPG